MIRAENPSGPSLLEKSKATPGSVDMAIFSKKSNGQGAAQSQTGGSSPMGQGRTSSNYLQKTREDNPETPDDKKTESVTLGNCRIVTDPTKLASEQPFEMSVDVKGPESATTGIVTFNLFCDIPKADGTDESKDLSSPSQGRVVDGKAVATGTLAAPDPAPTPGTKIKYYLSAQHPNAAEKAESPKVEVESGKPPRPLAVWTLDAIHFGFNSSFILPSAAPELADLKAVLAKHAGSALAIFGHADPVGDDEGNKKLSGRRAYAIHSLLTKNPSGWLELSNGATGDKWDLRATQTMLAHLKGKSGGAYYGGSIDGKTGPKTQAAVTAFQKDNGLKPDGVAGPKTHTKLYELYMASICEATCKVEDFVGDPKDPKHQWACSGCSEFNPILVFSKADDAGFRQAADKSARNAKNAPNRRATVALFPDSAKGPGNVTFPCPDWKSGSSKCRTQFYDDADKRRNPSDVERTWEKDKDTFACRFYAEIGKESVVVSGPWAIANSVIPEQFRKLAGEMTEPEFILWCSNIFGYDIREESYRKLREALIEDEVMDVEYEISESLPPSIDKKGEVSQVSLAAYMQPGIPENPGAPKIIVTTPVVQGAWDDEDGMKPTWDLYNILAHEYGHHLDYLLRYVYSTARLNDSVQEEGARFAYAMIPLIAENSAYHKVCDLYNGEQQKEIRAKLEMCSEFIEKLAGLDQQLFDARAGVMEFFGAGDLHESYEDDPLKEPIKTCGHRHIEAGLDTDGGAADHWWMKSRPERQDYLYFGNWLRDFSQVVDPKVILDKQGVCRQKLTKIVDFLAYREFYWDKRRGGPKLGRLPGTYDVSEERLGLYRPEEHMDNPWGIGAAEYPFKGENSAQFRVACPYQGDYPDYPWTDKNQNPPLPPPDAWTNPELLPDPRTWVSNYLTSDSYDGKERCSTSNFVNAEFRRAMQSTDEKDFLRHLGGAMHAIEDLYAHSNFLELTIRYYCNWTESDIPAWTPPCDAISGNYPLVTGSFGGLDTVCSLVYIVIDLLEAYCKAKKKLVGKPFKEWKELQKKKFALELLLVNFLVDDSPEELEVAGYKIGKNLKAVVTVIYLLKNGEEVDPAMPDTWPPEVRASSNEIQDLYKAWLDSPIKDILEHVSWLVDQTITPVMITAAQLLVGALELFAKNVDEYQTVQQVAANQQARPGAPLASAGYPIVPTHSQLSKDHGDHPLHMLAAQCAAAVAKSIADYAIDNWTNGRKGEAEIAHLCQIANGYIFHPARWEDAPTEEIKGKRKEILDLIKTWVENPSNRTALLTLASTEFHAKQAAKIKDVLEQIRKRRLQLAGILTNDPERYVDDIRTRAESVVKILNRESGTIRKEPKVALKNIKKSISKNLPASGAQAKKAISQVSNAASELMGKAGAQVGSQAMAAAQNAIPGAAKVASDLGGSAANTAKSTLSKAGNLTKRF